MRDKKGPWSTVQNHVRPKWVDVWIEVDFIHLFSSVVGVIIGISGDIEDIVFRIWRWHEFTLHGMHVLCILERVEEIRKTMEYSIGMWAFFSCCVIFVVGDGVDIFIHSAGWVRAWAVLDFDTPSSRSRWKLSTWALRLEFGYLDMYTYLDTGNIWKSSKALEWKMTCG